MDIEISGSSSPISCEVLGIGDNYARDDCESRRKLEFKDDDDFFNTDVPTKEEGEQYVLHNSLDATSDINLLHSQIPHEAIPKVDMKFKTEEAAYEFYNAYAYKVGFSVRRSKEYKDKSGMLVTRTFCCSCEGKRGKDKRDSIVKSHRPETRFGCLARKKIKYCRQTKQYYVVEFNPVHNHAVCTPSKTHLHKSHRKLSVAQAAELDMANDCGIGPKATVEFMARQAGGRENLGFIPQDYNLEDNDWLKRMFNQKEKWALVYGRQTFCADMTTTQRSESMNSVLKNMPATTMICCSFSTIFEG
ncbi:hypothetical protein RHMOL_Rhmol04G0353300 [Rhododendron molle]|uniref:Uncharacterized protein n=1 Tax=Rhododendron molle TaxID=49168 RepID=A0ACC0P8X6_RHOML|nr:hypothetical protein RHMOL_Rhmol04G0353300 [Rhododendron molle]